MPGAPLQWEIDSLDKRGSIRVTLADHDEHDSGPFDFGDSYKDGTLNRVIESLLALRAQVPKEYRETARCGFGMRSQYDSSYVTIEVSYSRPETDAEWAARRANVEHRRQVYADQLAALERAEFDRLKAKFGT